MIYHVYPWIYVVYTWWIYMVYPWIHHVYPLRCIYQVYTENRGSRWVLVRRRAVRRAGRQEVATGNLRDPRELATGHHLHHPCSPGCLSPTQVVAGPANPIVGPSPRPAGPGRTSRSQEASVDRQRRRTGHSCEPDWPEVLAKGSFGGFH